VLFVFVYKKNGTSTLPDAVIFMKQRSKKTYTSAVPSQCYKAMAAYAIILLLLECSGWREQLQPV